LTPQGLVAALLHLIEKRRAEYLELIGKIAKDDYDFLQLLPIVDAMLGTVDRDVQIMIRKAQEASAAAREAKDGATLGLGILAMLLTIFPPTAPLGLALGAGLAISGFAQGYEDFQHGMMYSQGTGAEIFSPEQEAAAGMMMAGGLLNMALSAYSLAATGIAARTLARGPAPSPSTQLAKPPSAAGFEFGEVTSAWRVVSQNVATGEYVVVGKNLAPGAAGEMVTVRVNVKTGMGTATYHGPNPQVVPIVNAQLQFPAGLLPAAGGGATSAAGLVTMPARPAPPAAPLSLAPTGPVAPAAANPSFMLPYLMPGPLVSGGARVGAFPSNIYNPCGSDENCGFTSIAYGLQYQQPTLFRNADVLYQEQFARLGVSPEENLSQQLIFPMQSYEGLKPRPGYEALFSGDGNRLSDYTLTSVAESSGLKVIPQSETLRMWRIAFGRNTSLDEAVANRLAFLEGARHSGRPMPSEEAVRAFMEEQRRQLPGTYIIGSKSRAHYMTMRIEPDGTLIGFDPQNLVEYRGIDAITTRMGEIDLAVRIAPLP
jgi:hypothetical protein